MFGWFRRKGGGEGAGPSADPTPEVASEVATIRACRERFGPPPRVLAPADAEAFRLTLTKEVAALFEATGDPMLGILADQPALRDRGRVVWGQLVQANQMLFDPTNRHTLAANVLYSLDSHFEGRLALLAKYAKGLFDHKGTVPTDRSIREFVRVITDEQERVMRRELPARYCGGRTVYFANCFIQPSHLPGNCLRLPFFPLVVNPEETDAVMILPARFWPGQLLGK